ncbi:hypothetical protein FACS1894159_00450 [Bacteroidia bacterium]|nr:hypothetical protein FACS1894159_00450 [Bacteroidia bacterium]
MPSDEEKGGRLFARQHQEKGEANEEEPGSVARVADRLRATAEVARGRQASLCLLSFAGVLLPANIRSKAGVSLRANK